MDLKDGEIFEKDKRHREKAYSNTSQVPFKYFDSKFVLR